MDIITQLSPFSERRREKETPPTPLYLNYSEYKDWITTNNYVIEGTRGTGKTSILKTLSYETLWLKMTEIRPSDELTLFFKDSPDFIGLYFRCEVIEKSFWNKWYVRYAKENDDESSIQILFATILNYFFIEQIINSVIAITKEESIETDLIKEIYQECFPISELKPTLYDYSLSSLRNVINISFHNIRRQVYSLCSFEEINNNYCLHSAASCIISKIAGIINSKIKLFKNKKIFLLIDDVDRLDKWQLRVLNTFISSSESPVSLKLTCTGDYATKLNTNGRSISTTDLFISKLNDEEDPTNKKNNKKIDELFTAIFNLRLESRSIENKATLDKLFQQDFDFEEVFLSTLKTSANETIKAELKEYENSEYHDRLSDFYIDKYQIDSRYTRERIIKNNLDKDNIDHKYYSKYRISVIFSTIHRYNLQASFVYYSFNIIKMISSGSPRHFLRICDKLWETIFYYFSDSRYEKTIDESIQNLAIRNASFDVYNNMNFDELEGKIEVSYKTMCERLAQIFTLFIQLDSIKITPECQSLLVNFDKLNQNDRDWLHFVIDRLRMFEAIKTKELTKPNQVLIALSPMLTPVFTLPYRSPFSYWYTLPEPSILIKLLKAKDLEAKSIIANIYNDRISLDSSPKLFPNE